MHESVDGPSSARIDRIRDAGEWIPRMAGEVREGLLARPLPSLPSKHFYDDAGSQLFEEITVQPEYYQTRTEEAILDGVADEIVEAARPRELCELGSGVGHKVRLLLDAMQSRGLLERCVMLEINELYLTESVARLNEAYPELSVRGVVGDFLEDLPALGPGGGRMGLFLAGTLGNLHPTQVTPFLQGMARQLAPGDSFLLGVDLVKDERLLHAAYNDAAGVTARFNRNILNVMNRALGADFDPSAFEHVAFYDADNQWIEMRLRATRSMRVHVPGADLDVTFAPGDEIRTELSCKYTRETLSARLEGTGLEIEQWHTDPDDLFVVTLLRRTDEEVAPLA
jgi:L-histidine N-alpha-methyltransferase